MSLSTATARTQGIALFGASGSIGQSALDVIARHPELFHLHAVAAGSRVEPMVSLCRAHRPEIAIMSDADAAESLRRRLDESGVATEVRQGSEALASVAASEQVDTVIAAIIGAAGLDSTLAAARAGKRILLANKEALVMSGALLMDEIRRSGASLLPLDSEHNAIFQCLPEGACGAGVEQLILTASGGPMRTWSRRRMAEATPEQALKHPNWSMGPKITIDSATMMNKGLEIIEACHLFAMPLERIEVVVHPQSVVHSMVRYSDGSVLAQLGAPDMRTPIAHALGWPLRIDAGVQPIDLVALARMDFEAPDPERFPALRLAREAMARGDTAPAVLNAANEVAVAAFLERRVSFLQLTELVEQVMSKAEIATASDLATIIEADRNARRIANSLLGDAAKSLSPGMPSV